MANELSARALDPDAPSEDEYQALCAALSASARGRAFLAEYARRQRAADTEMLMAAMERLEGLVRYPAPPPPEPMQASAEAMRAELQALLDEIRVAQRANDVGGLTVQVAQLAATIEQVERRLETIVAPVEDQAFVLEEVAMPAALADEAAEPVGEVTPAEIASEAAEEATDEFETLPAPAEELRPAQAQTSGIPEVGWFAEQPPRASRAAPSTTAASATAAALAIAAVIEAAALASAADEPAAPKVTVFKAGTIPPPEPFAGEDFAQSPPAQQAAQAAPPADPLAPIMALSEEERLALFT